MTAQQTDLILPLVAAYKHAINCSLAVEAGGTSILRLRRWTTAAQMAAALPTAWQLTHENLSRVCERRLLDTAAVKSLVF